MAIMSTLWVKRVLPMTRPGARWLAGGFSVDRRGLVNVPPSVVQESKLTRDLRVLIETLGPITVADYMQHALQHPMHGYYTGQDSQIGRDGDFTTAPEISQLFGEAIGVWCVAVWTAMGQPPKFNLVEMGPGKGTLMKDVLRTARTFPRFREAATVHLVETSPALRQKQRETLGCVAMPDSLDAPAPAPAQESKAGRAAGTGSLAGLGEAAAALKELAEEEDREAGGEKEAMRMLLSDGGEVHWHNFFADVPEGPMVFLGQEILDALPVHQFEYTSDGWRERLVDLASPSSAGSVALAPGSGGGGNAGNGGGGNDGGGNGGGDGGGNDDGGGPVTRSELVDLPLRFILSKNATPAVNAYLTGGRKKKGAAKPESRVPSFEPSSWREDEAAELRKVLARNHTHGAAPSDPSPQKEEDEIDACGAAPGDEIEVCPRANALVQDVGTRLARHRGGALFVDYGGNHAFPNSLRGFYRHQEAHPLYRPGEVDLTCDVDFAALRRLATRTEGVQSHGPVDQGWFLEAMGAPQRLMQLLEQSDVSDDAAEALVGSYERLVDPGQMGERYKVLALVDARQPSPPPGGFAEAAAAAAGTGEEEAGVLAK